ncbi:MULTISPECIES: hypothetical protein [Bradyrhizobium]|uniref:hypothetical protein n=1 Tax=Bradyrhizobium TaxID=374 RepID=UPI002714B6EE|nr:hypothetical protein [Bradyrhizobium elkanii]WLA46661.1 hypothetical protein QIH80_33675 [Bradyrhizobium elkanii]WLB83053.1 hypothetical protein QIH83_11050 [Bradyrhizobium elkanii]
MSLRTGRSLGKFPISSTYSLVIAVALIRLRVSVALKIREPKPSPIRRSPHLVLLVILPAERPINLLRSLDGLDQFGTLPAEHQPNSVLPVGVGMLQEIPKNAVRLPSAARAAEAKIG